MATRLGTHVKVEEAGSQHTHGKISEWLASNDVVFCSDGEAWNCTVNSEVAPHFLGNGTASFNGNQRFHFLLQKHCQEYAAATKMQRSLVALKILQTWKKQKPPGRFFVLQEEKRLSLPVFKGMGDKKARSRISKFLKELVNKGDHLAENNERSCGDETAVTAELSENHSISSKPDSGGIPSPEQPLARSSATPMMSDLPIQSRVSTVTNNDAQKIYGREKELQSLTNIFQKQQLRRNNQRYNISTGGETSKQTTTDLVLLSGELGTGKSALLQAWSREITAGVSIAAEMGSFLDSMVSGSMLPEDESSRIPAQEPVLLKSNIAPFNWAEPYRVFLNLMEDCCLQLMQRSAEHPTLLRTLGKILADTLQEDFALLLDVIPILKEWGFAKPPCSPIHSLSIPLARDRIKPLQRNGQSSNATSENSGNTIESPVSKSLNSITDLGNVTKERIEQVVFQFFQATSSLIPLVVILEDLHWASENCMTLLGHLVEDSKCCANVMFVGTYRTGTKFIRSFFWKRLQHWRESPHLNVAEINLSNLTVESIHYMVADTFHLGHDDAKRLQDIVFDRTKGNPEFTWEVIRLLQENGSLRLDAVTGEWTCDISHLRSFEWENVHTLLDLWKGKAKTLPEKAQETLKLVASLMEPTVKKDLIALVLPDPVALAHLDLAEEVGLVKRSEGKYTFNEVARQAVHEMVPEKDRPLYHLKLGQALWDAIDFNGEFTSCNGIGYGKYMLMQLSLSRELIKREEDARAIATLFYKAGTSASKNTAWIALNTGVSIMAEQEKAWGKDNYDLSLNLYNAAIEIGHCNGNFTEVDELITEVLKNARTAEDTLIAQVVRVKTLCSQKNEMAAIKFAIGTLENLGERIPLRPTIFQVLREYHRATRLLKGKSDEDIMGLPHMRDSAKLAVMQILARVYLYVCFTDHKLLLVCGCRMIFLTIKHGLSALSSIAFGIYGATLAGLDPKNISDGMRYGKLAMAVAERYRKDAWFGQAISAYYGVLYAKVRPVREGSKPLRKACRIGLRAGDIEGALMNGSLRMWNTQEFMSVLEVDRSCTELANDAKYYSGQSMSAMMLKPLWQFHLNLMGEARGDPKSLEGELVDNDLQEAKQANVRDHHLLMNADVYALKLAYLFGDIELAKRHMHGCIWMHKNYPGTMMGTIALTYYSLLLLAQARHQKKQIFWHLQRTRRNLKALKTIVEGCPENFLGKQILIEANLAAVSGDSGTAFSKYRMAISQNQADGFWMEEALANEQLGKFYLEKKRESDAIPFLLEAQRVYEQWGAKAKAQQLATEYGDIVGTACH